MKINTNTWNKIRYTLYSPIYNAIAFFLEKSRKLSIESLSIKTGEKILIVGAGTGLDLDHLPADCQIIATDLTPAMVEKIKQRNKKLKKQVTALVMDGQKLEFEENTFDKVILHLILAVIPNPVVCLLEVERVLKLNGEIAVYDKFVKKNTNISTFRRVVNIISNLFFTDITRRFEEIVTKTKLEIISDENAELNGNFRRIKLRKIM